MVCVCVCVAKIDLDSKSTFRGSFDISLELSHTIQTYPVLLNVILCARPDPGSAIRPWFELNSAHACTFTSPLWPLNAFTWQATQAVSWIVTSDCQKRSWKQDNVVVESQNLIKRRSGGWIGQRSRFDMWGCSLFPSSLTSSQLFFDRPLFYRP